MNGTPSVRILLVDDQPLIRMGFRMVLEGAEGLTVVGEAGDGAEAIAQAAELRPDVVLMDVRMPGVDGIEATEVIVARNPGVRVLVVTTYDLDEYAFASLRAGASGFLLKNARPEDLVAAIRTVAAGDAIVAPRITRRMLDLFAGQLPTPRAPDAAGGGPIVPAPPPEPVVPDPRLAVLTEREREVFVAMARGLSNAEICRSMYLSESTVKTHVGHVLMKLGVRDRIHAVMLGYETGVVSPSAGGTRGPGGATSSS